MSKWVVVLDAGIQVLLRHAMLRFISLEGLVLCSRANVFRSGRFRWGMLRHFRLVQVINSFVRGGRRAPPATLVRSGPWRNETPSISTPGQDTARSVGGGRVALGQNPWLLPASDSRQGLRPRGGRSPAALCCQSSGSPGRVGAATQTKENRKVGSGTGKGVPLVGDVFHCQRWPLSLALLPRHPQGEVLAERHLQATLTSPVPFSVPPAVAALRLKARPFLCRGCTLPFLGRHRWKGTRDLGNGPQNEPRAPELRLEVLEHDWGRLWV